MQLVRENIKWDHDGQDYFDGEVEPCINGKAVAAKSGKTITVEDPSTRTKIATVPHSGKEDINAAVAAETLVAGLGALQCREFRRAAEQMLRLQMKQ